MADFDGRMVATVIRDEWLPIAPAAIRAGDIAVWTIRFDHSAIFTNPVITSGALDMAATTLSSKNGQSALATYTLPQLAGVYGEAGIAAFRHR